MSTTTPPRVAPKLSDKIARAVRDFSAAIDLLDHDATNAEGNLGHGDDCAGCSLLAHLAVAGAFADGLINEASVVENALAASQGREKALEGAMRWAIEESDNTTACVYCNSSKWRGLCPAHAALSPPKSCDNGCPNDSPVHKLSCAKAGEPLSPPKDEGKAAADALTAHAQSCGEYEPPPSGASETGCSLSNLRNRCCGHSGPNHMDARGGPQCHCGNPSDFEAGDCYSCRVALTKAAPASPDPLSEAQKILERIDAGKEVPDEDAGTTQIEDWSDEEKASMLAQMADLLRAAQKEREELKADVAREIGLRVKEGDECNAAQAKLEQERDAARAEVEALKYESDANARARDAALARAEKAERERDEISAANGINAAQANQRQMRIDRLEQEQKELRAQLAAAWPTSPTWTPTPENINALPIPLRKYIAALETDCDPAGTIRSNVERGENVAALALKVKELEGQLAAAEAKSGGLGECTVCECAVDEDDPLTCWSCYCSALDAIEQLLRAVDPKLAEEFNADDQTWGQVKEIVGRAVEKVKAAEARATKAERERATLSADQIKHMVDRFLGWKLPEDFSPDAGISFKPNYNEGTAWPMRHGPVGTNLFSAIQAEAMVRHMIEGMPVCATTEARVSMPLRLPCPSCGELHIDEGEFATKPHHTHSCQHCGMTWRPAVEHTVGVRFLPGFKNNPSDKSLCPDCKHPMSRHSDAGCSSDWSEPFRGCLCARRPGEGIPAAPQERGGEAKS